MADPQGARITGAAGESGADDDWVSRRLAQRLARSAEAEGAPGGGSASGAAAHAPTGSASRDKRRSGRRREERRTGIASRARIAFRGREQDVSLLNLSRRGCMIGAEFGTAGDRIAILFPDCNPLHATVCWAEDGRTGIEFALQTALLIPSHWRLSGGRRCGEMPTGGGKAARPPRHKLMWECELHWSRGVERARVRNVSAQGAMIDNAKNVPVDTEVTLVLRSAGTVTGRVRWSRAGQIGLRFDRAFDIRKLISPAGISAGATSSSRPGILKPLYLESELDPSSPWAGQKDKLDPKDFR
jgi:hypothetical protein